ncbi:MAG: type II toxin-antitoxin system RelE/ParE family toxin [Planctomycetaceae bacterium]|nr:type II toxin-antitoxin system RelE/ParE family toxin [Planctomycetaceae bacterium]
MSFRVVVTARAERDLKQIGDWLMERSPEGAKSWTSAAWKAIKRLGGNPRTCPFAPENGRSDREVRNVMFRTRRGRTYRAVFVIEGDAVFVTHFRGPGQDVLSSADIEQTFE